MNRFFWLFLFLSCVYFSFNFGKGIGKRQERELWIPIVKIVETQAITDSLTLEIIEKVIPSYKLFFDDSTWDKMTQAE